MLCPTVPSPPKEKGDKGKKLDLRKTGRGEALIGFNMSGGPMGALSPLEVEAGLKEDSRCVA